MSSRSQAVADRPWLAATVVLAGVVHIASVFAMPDLAPDDAFSRLAQLGPLNEFHPLPRAVPGAELVPYNDPAVAQGVCRYDIVQGPLHIRAKLSGDTFVSLSFHSRRGVVFYALTDSASTHQGFDILLATADQLKAVQAKDVEDEPPQELRVLAPSAEGFVFARALANLPSTFADATREIAGLGCDVEPRPSLNTVGSHAQARRLRGPAPGAEPSGESEPSPATGPGLAEASASLS